MLSNRFRLSSGLRIYYTDDMALALDLDPYTMQQGYVKLDARFTLTDIANQWELSVIGRNLTDKITSNFANDLSGRFSEGSYFRFTESPRAIALQGVIRF